MFKEVFLLDFSMFENMRFGGDCTECRRSSDFRMNNRNLYDVPQSDCEVSRFPEQTPLAMTYTPMQQWGAVYNESEALSVGTIFPELNFPLEPEGGCYGQR